MQVPVDVATWHAANWYMELASASCGHGSMRPSRSALVSLILSDRWRGMGHGRRSIHRHRARFGICASAGHAMRASSACCTSDSPSLSALI
eukprot:7869687-Alexandrium_andersonii.AAC.1